MSRDCFSWKSLGQSALVSVGIAAVLLCVCFASDRWPDGAPGEPLGSQGLLTPAVTPNPAAISAAKTSPAADRRWPGRGPAAKIRPAAVAVAAPQFVVAALPVAPPASAVVSEVAGANRLAPTAQRRGAADLAERLRDVNRDLAARDAGAHAKPAGPSVASAPTASKLLQPGYVGAPRVAPRPLAPRPLVQPAFVQPVRQRAQGTPAPAIRTSHAPASDHPVVEQQLLSVIKLTPQQKLRVMRLQSQSALAAPRYAANPRLDEPARHRQ